MKKRITLLANTKRKDDGVCIAGIDTDGSWVRPVKVNGNYLVTNDLFLGNDVIIDTFCEVDFELDMYMPVPPNTEDYKISEDKRPELIRKISGNKERFDLLAKYVDSSVDSIFDGGNRSLGLVKCNEILEVKAGWNDAGKFYSTISFTDNTGMSYDLSTTDLRWAAFVKNILAKEGLQNLHLNKMDLKRVLKHEDIFLSLGLARETDVTMKELIIGVFTIPDYAECKSFWDIQLLEES